MWTGVLTSFLVKLDMGRVAVKSMSASISEMSSLNPLGIVVSPVFDF